jgi:hypothetical protein
MKLNVLPIILSLFLAASAWALDPLPKAPAFDGPNCWNAALKAVRILPHFRYSNAREMNFYSKSPLCYQIDASEKQIGDIGLIRADQVAGPGEYHAFVMVTENGVYSKNGMKQTTSYVYWSLEAVLRWYTSPPLPLIFIRCQSLATYLDAHPNIPGFYLETIGEITAYEKALEQLVMKGIPLDEMHERDIYPITQKYLDNLAPHQGEVSNMPEEERTFAQGVIRERLLSIAGQLGHANKAYLLVEIGLMFGRLP